jgi:hypothetical protein
MFHSLPRRTNRFSCIIGQSLSVARTLSLCFAVFRVCLDRQRTGTFHAYSSAQILLDFQGTAECTTRFPKIYEMAASTSQNVDPRKRKSGPSAPDAYSKRRQTDAASNSVATKSKTGRTVTTRPTAAQATPAQVATTEAASASKKKAAKSVKKGIATKKNAKAKKNVSGTKVSERKDNDGDDDDDDDDDDDKSSSDDLAPRPGRPSND